MLTVVGDLKDAEGKTLCEVLELWRRDLIECVPELIGKTSIKGMRYAPEKVFLDETGKEERIDECWTAAVWWYLQQQLREGATVVPIILGSDKTQLSVFSGDKSSWPVYLTIGNIPKADRRCPSKRTQTLLGYLPISKLKIFAAKSTRKIEIYRLFHRCMRILLGPLYSAGSHATEMVCADSAIRDCHLFLVANVCDHPEMCLVGCCQENVCPTCDTDPEDRGDPEPGDMKDTEDLAHILRDHGSGLKPREFDDLNLRSVPEPYWSDLPHCDIGMSFAPDLLHQMYKGVFKDHLVSWCTTAVGEGPAGEREVDSRFMKLPKHSEAHHFKRGISAVSQWTGHERKEMAKVFYGILVNAVEPEVAIAAKAILDFLMYSRLQVQTTSTLRAMKEALHTFHCYKEIFVEKGIRDNFNIAKIHSMLHYIEKIRCLGTTDGFNTETTERLHIDLAKEAYRASNKRDYHAQMTKYLSRLEALDKFTEYLVWKHDKDDKEAEVRRRERRARRAARNLALGKRKRNEEAAQPRVQIGTTPTNVIQDVPPPVVFTRYKISKKAQEVDRHISTELVETRHKAVDFTQEVFKYVTTTLSSSIESTDRLKDLRFDIFRKFTLTLPRLYHM